MARIGFYMRKKRLTPREQQVMDLLLLGKKNKEIGLKLDITEKTVKFHLTSVYSFYKVKSAKQLLATVIK